MAFNFFPVLVRAAFAIFSSLVIVRHGIKKKSLDLTGAVASVFVGFVLTFSNLCFFASCATFFLTSSKLTRYKSEEKEKLEDDFKKGNKNKNQRRNYKPLLPIMYRPILNECLDQCFRPLVNTDVMCDEIYF